MEKNNIESGNLESSIEVMTYYEKKYKRSLFGLNTSLKENKDRWESYLEAAKDKDQNEKFINWMIENPDFVSYGDAIKKFPHMSEEAKAYSMAISGYDVPDKIEEEEEEVYFPREETFILNWKINKLIGTLMMEGIINEDDWGSAYRGMIRSSNLKGNYSDSSDGTNMIF